MSSDGSSSANTLDIWRGWPEDATLELKVKVENFPRLRQHFRLAVGSTSAVYVSHFRWLGRCFRNRIMEALLMQATQSQSPGPKRRPRCAAACDTCKRRKERCDGSKPCGRCTERGVHTQCRFSGRTRLAQQSSPSSRGVETNKPKVPATFGSPPSPCDSAQRLHREEASEVLIAPTAETRTSSEPGLNPSRLIQDQKDRFMFIGDSGNLSFLQTIRRLVGPCIGACRFVEDSLRYSMVEAVPDGRSYGSDIHSRAVQPRISLTEAQGLIESYAVATSCVLDLFDIGELLEHLPAWLGDAPSQYGISSAVYCLILAIGAQTNPEEKDELAEALFTHGRILSARDHMEAPSMATVQSYSLITMYLLGASRRNAASMHLGVALQAAHAIGLHQREVSTRFSQTEFQMRERLWRVVRILDLFMSASLGRPPATTETRDTEAESEHYSASADLCALFEKILKDVYSRRRISSETLSKISAHQRRWSSRFLSGLAADKIEPIEMLDQGDLPDIGLLHVKGAYYWTIILLTRPYMTASIALHIKKARLGNQISSEPCTAADTNKVLVHGCVDSAIRTIDLCKVIIGRKRTPRRLPCVVNSVFVAALVLGVAHFGDLYHVFPLQRYMRLAHTLLESFANDNVAQRNAEIVQYLSEACNVYLDNRLQQDMNSQSLAVGSMFGQIHRLPSQVPTRAHSPAGRRTVVGDPSVEDNGDGGAGEIRNTLDVGSAAIATNPADGISNNHAWFGGLEGDVLDAFPILSPPTLWFDPFDENFPFFSTISSTAGHFVV